MSDNYIKVCASKDIKLGDAKNVTVDGIEITIFHTEKGYIAHSGYCKHNAFKLELCEISGDIVRCPRHGWKYRISSGQGIKPSWTSLENYPVELRGEEIWVNPTAEESATDFDTSAYDW
jgi:nitrite reductase/ring-hydroxylating ferredoxin subunit